MCDPVRQGGSPVTRLDCFECDGTGRIPCGTFAPNPDRLCPDCDGSGRADLTDLEDFGDLE